MTANQLAIRRTPNNENHHLWNNSGTWWCHYTLHSGDYQKIRVRRSLGTAEVAQARALRDALLAAICTPASRPALGRVAEAATECI
jgi:hypothetical protein